MLGPTEVETDAPAERASQTKIWPLDLDTGVLRRNRVLRQQTNSAEFYLGFGDRDSLLQRLAEAEAMLKAGFDPNQPRDSDGRWTSGGGATGSWSQETGHGASGSWFQENAVSTAQAEVLAVGAGALAGGRLDWTIFRRVGPQVVEALATMGRWFSAPTLAFGAWFMPLRDGAAGSGTLPGYPNIRYGYDEDRGEFVLYTKDDHTILFEGTTGGDGLIRTKEGDVIGRKVDGSVIIDDDFVFGAKPEEAKDAEGAGAVAQADAQAVAIARTDIRLCPDPEPARPGFKRERAVAYEEWVGLFINPQTPTPASLAYYLPNPNYSGNPRASSVVEFDDCSHQDWVLPAGALVEVKGPGLADLLKYPWGQANFDADGLDQAYRQVSAAGNHPLYWFVEEEAAYEHYSKLFSGPILQKIKLRHLPFPGLPEFDQYRKFMNEEFVFVEV
jgi:hypothetical protein